VGGPAGVSEYFMDFPVVSMGEYHLQQVRQAAGLRRTLEVMEGYGHADGGDREWGRGRCGTGRGYQGAVGGCRETSREEVAAANLRGGDGGGSH